MIETLVLGVTAFVGTNIDDMFINTLLFSEAEGAADRRAVVLGKYLGLGALVGLSILGAFGLQFLPQKYIGLLGLVPVGLGIKEILEAGKPDAEEGPERQDGNFLLNAAVITMANGADNVGVYLPLFAGFAVWQIWMTAGVFAVMNGLWCWLGKKLADLPLLRTFLEKRRAVVVPVVYLGLGAYILWKNFL